MTKEPSMTEKSLVLPNRYFVLVGGKKFEVESLSDASNKYRAVIEALDVGGSEIPREYVTPLIVDTNNKIIGHIAYNGKIFPGKPEEELYKTHVPLYNPYQNVEVKLNPIDVCHEAALAWDKYEDDVKAGHTDAVPYWQGQAEVYSSFCVLSMLKGMSKEEITKLFEEKEWVS